MKPIKILLAVFILALFSVAAYAAGPVADPSGIINDSSRPALPEGLKAFGDPTDLQAAALQGAQYLRMLQADVTEDNAGNGMSDIDPDDAGWDWEIDVFEHTSGASPTNLYGVIAGNLLLAYQLDPTPAIRTALDDVADYTLSSGPSVLRTAHDISFLLAYADLPGVVDPALYRQGAKDIWTYRLANYGDGTATGFAEYQRDYRANQNYTNGIIPWEISNYVEAIAELDLAFPGEGFDIAADDMAEVIYQDSYMLIPGHFDFQDRNMGADPTYSNLDYYWYTLGVQGIYRAFDTAGVHTSELASLEALLSACQYPDGAFSYQYGADETFNDRTYQGSAYAVELLAQYGTDKAAAYNGAVWLATWQDTSGGWVYDDGFHHPEIGAECLGAIAASYAVSTPVISASADGPDPIQCGENNTITFQYTPAAGTPGLRGYELTLDVVGPVDTISATSFADAGLFAGFSNSQFYVVDNGDGTFTINDAILGATPGLMTAGNMFTVTLTTNSDGPVDINVLSYKMRDPDNNDIFGDVSGMSFVVDCTAPGPVDSFVGSPGHEKADLEWTMGDISDVAGFEIYRAVRYDLDPAVSSYPEYNDNPDDTIPTRPSNRGTADASAEWELIHTAAAGDVAYTDNEADRGIYYYEIFAFDAAFNYGPPAADPVRVMNYWLGDVSDGTYTQFDGLVDGADISALGSYFGTTIAYEAAANHLDVGPTDDNSRLGIPETDNEIDFEDLMIFAMNYNVVSPAKSDAVPGAVAYLTWNRLEDGRYAVGVNNANGMKGLRIEGSDAINAVTAGRLLAEQDEMVFMTNVGSQLDANVAVMGLDKAFVGTGDLMIINAVGELDPAELTFTARGLDNSEMEISFEQSSGVQTPNVFSLAANYPNPFNPMTKISFSLPEAQDVVLTVYGLDGRKVATLINETRDAGSHDVVWTGRDDRGQMVASGTYFYRINAGPYSQVRKMTLMK